MPKGLSIKIDFMFFHVSRNELWLSACHSIDSKVSATILGLGLITVMMMNRAYTYMYQTLVRTLVTCEKM